MADGPPEPGGRPVPAEWSSPRAVPQAARTDQAAGSIQRATGNRSSVPWAFVFPKSLQIEPRSVAELVQLHASGALEPFARHPSQLYEMLLEGAVLFFLVWRFSSRPRRRYAVSGLFALGYGVMRIAVEFVREPDEHLGFLAFDWLTMGMLLSVPLVVTGLVLLAMSMRAPYPPRRAAHGDEALPTRATAQPPGER